MIDDVLLDIAGIAQLVGIVIVVLIPDGMGLCPNRAEVRWMMRASGHGRWHSCRCWIARIASTRSEI